jgi:hypothetical protein
MINVPANTACARPRLQSGGAHLSGSENCATMLITVFFTCLPPTFVEYPLSNPLSFRPGNHPLSHETILSRSRFSETCRLATQNRQHCVILRSKATKNLVFAWKNETLRGVYPERSRRAQGDNCDLLGLFISYAAIL